ncbi:hypothetical protein Golomagni_06796 [Golovinomyces magnicellulatus]|nr:hypothetical protein Golomagni_06796 [Golovinomyces magnicellulatus]
MSTPSLITLGIEGGNSIFYFAGFIAYALFLTDLVVCDGASCTLARATAVIAAAEFSAWISSTILTAKDWFRTEETKDAILRRQMRQEQADLP